MEVQGIIKKHRLWVKIAVIFIGLYLLYFSISNEKWLYLPVDITLILAVFADRKHVISEKGVDILYLFCGYPIHNIWEWHEILAIHTDTRHSKPDVELHFSKGVVNRRILVRAADVDTVLHIARKNNPALSVREVDR